jgi:hypothetical protein
LVTKQAKLHLFKTLTNFTLVEFDEVLPTISTHAQSTGGEVVISSLGFDFFLFATIFSFNLQG